MDPGRIILRRIIDDPKSRQKAFGILRKEHFADKVQRALYSCIKAIHVDGVFSYGIIADYIISKGYPQRANDALCSELGSIFGDNSVLEAEFEYALHALASTAQSDVIFKIMQESSVLLSQGKIDDAIQHLCAIPQLSGTLAIASERRISARSMEALRPDDELSKFCTGFSRIDEITGGGRLGELWLWAAYTGEMKSTSLIAIAHSLMLRGKRVLFVSLEMDEVELKRRLLCQHAHYLGQNLPYRDIERGTCDQDVYAQVVKDFDSNSSYGDIQIWQPPLGVTILDVARELEICCAKVDCEILILDYIQKLGSINQRKDFRSELNATLDTAKKLAMEARSRNGVWLISGYQTSTEGRKKAEDKGFYDLWALSETIGASQISNVVVWSLVTEKMKRDKEMKVGIAKSRNSSIANSIHFLPVDPAIGLIGRDPVTKRNFEEEVEDSFIEDLDE